MRKKSLTPTPTQAGAMSANADRSGSRSRSREAQSNDPSGKALALLAASPPSFTHLDHRSVNALIFKPDQSTGLGRLWIIHA